MRRLLYIILSQGFKHELRVHIFSVCAKVASRSSEFLSLEGSIEFASNPGEYAFIYVTDLFVGMFYRSPGHKTPSKGLCNLSIAELKTQDTF